MMWGLFWWIMEVSAGCNGWGLQRESTSMTKLMLDDPLHVGSIHPSHHIDILSMSPPSQLCAKHHSTNKTTGNIYQRPHDTAFPCEDTIRPRG